jgi:hypothetical protein
MHVIHEHWAFIKGIIMSEAQPHPDVIQVQELDNPNQVNRMLEVGWILLNTRNIRPDSSGEITVYVIGWPRSGGAIVDPIGDALKRRYNKT